MASVYTSWHVVTVPLICGRISPCINPVLLTAVLTSALVYLVAAAGKWTGCGTDVLSRDPSSGWTSCSAGPMCPAETRAGATTEETPDAASRGRRSVETASVRWAHHWSRNHDNRAVDVYWWVGAKFEGAVDGVAHGPLVNVVYITAPQTTNRLFFADAVAIDGWIAFPLVIKFRSSIILKDIYIQ